MTKQRRLIYASFFSKFLCYYNKPNKLSFILLFHILVLNFSFKINLFIFNEFILQLYLLFIEPCFIPSSLQHIQLHPTFAMNIMLNRPSNVKTTHECPVRKVPIYNGARKRQIITNSSPKLQIGDFQQYSQSSSNYHVSWYF